MLAGLEYRNGTLATVDTNAWLHHTVIMVSGQGRQPSSQQQVIRLSARLKLRYGPYRTPRFRYGSVVECAMQGDVRIVGLSNGRIPWPLPIRRPARVATST